MKKASRCKGHYLMRFLRFLILHSIRVISEKGEHSFSFRFKKFEHHPNISLEKLGG
jgi:hypothetical protein